MSAPLTGPMYVLSAGEPDTNEYLARLEKESSGPGKFEAASDPKLALHLWLCMLDGGGESYVEYAEDDIDGDCDPVFSADLFELDPNECEVFGVSENTPWIALTYSDMGFVYLTEAYSSREELEAFLFHQEK